MNIFQQLMERKQENGAGFLVLIDPDKLQPEKVPHFMQACRSANADAVLIGGSLLLSTEFESYVRMVKENAGQIPVILFPGGLNQVTKEADAVLFLSLISGRDPQHLIGSQALIAPLIFRMKLQTISTAYMLIESGKITSAQFMSGTTPIPGSKPDIAVAHALAAEYLGFKMIYLEAGSGAKNTVPDEMIQAVTKYTSVPVIVGGGIRDPETAARKVEAGASFVVTGTIMENNSNLSKSLEQFAAAIHRKTK